MRLLRVLPELSPGGLVCCEMEHARLDADTHLAFDALSYMWGSDLTHGTILVNDRAFAVRENLWGFLKIARCTRPYQWLWIDALSIAQANDNEKEQQIRLMRDIFKSAERVLIWLGSGHEAIESLMHLAQNDALAAHISLIRAKRDASNRQTLAHIGRTVLPRPNCHYPLDFQKNNPGVIAKDTDNFDRSWRTGAWEQDYKGCGDLGRIREELYYGDEILFQGTRALDRHPYWSRVWIIQEVFLSSKRTLLCGKWKLSWDQYHDLMQLFLPDIMQSRCSWKASLCQNNCYAHLHVHKNVYYLPHLREGRIPKDSDVAAILQRFDTTYCSVAHDHVYGVLALSEIIQYFPVDYNSGMVELLLNTFLFCITDSFVRDPDSTLRLPRASFSESGRSNFGNYLARKLQSISLERTKGSMSLFNPMVDLSVTESLCGAWKIFNISWLLAWFESRRSSLISTGLAGNLLTVFAEHIESFELIFLETNITYFDVIHDIILIIRETPLGRRVIGRATIERNLSIPYEIPVPRWKHEGWMVCAVILDTYGPDGLPGAEMLSPSLNESSRSSQYEDNNDNSPVDTSEDHAPSEMCEHHPFAADEAFFDSYTFGDAWARFLLGSGCRECSWKRHLAEIYFHDIRAAVILFMLPDSQSMREIAFPMLSSMDETNAFRDIKCYAITSGQADILTHAG